MLSPFPLVLMYFSFCQAEDSLKRESGSKVQHANIQASKVVFILLATRFQFYFQVILFVFFLNPSLTLVPGSSDALNISLHLCLQFH